MPRHKNFDRFQIGDRVRWQSPLYRDHFNEGIILQKYPDGRMKMRTLKSNDMGRNPDFLWHDNGFTLISSAPTTNCYKFTAKNKKKMICTIRKL